MSLGVILVDSTDYFGCLQHEVVVSFYYSVVFFSALCDNFKIYGLIGSEVKYRYFVVVIPFRSQPRLRRLQKINTPDHESDVLELKLSPFFSL